MNNVRNFLLSIREVIVLLIVQYAILIGIILVFGKNNGIVIGTLAIIFIEICYIIYKYRKDIFDINIGNNLYFPYVLLGTGIAVIYNMIIFKLGIINDVTNIDIFINIIVSAIIGPIFEEILFRYSLINKLEIYFSRKWSIWLSTIIFALCHTGIYTMIFAFIIGIVNGYLYSTKRDILIPIFVHISANMIATFLFGYNSVILILGFLLIIISYFIIKE